MWVSVLNQTGLRGRKSWKGTREGRGANSGMKLGRTRCNIKEGAMIVVRKEERVRVSSRVRGGVKGMGKGICIGRCRGKGCDRDSGRDKGIGNGMGKVKSTGRAEAEPGTRIETGARGQGRANTSRMGGGTG